MVFVSKRAYWYDEQGQQYDQDQHLSHNLHNTDETSTVNTYPSDKTSRSGKIPLNT
jgi:uncharacterized protein YcfL|tara:strand:- start:6245 stop:6412 length:168 start_codon:yes stop_codon:yes gene_type:complete